MNTLWTILGRSKYLIVVVVGVLVVGFVDENSFVKRIKNNMRISELNGQISEYREQYARDEALLRELRHNPDAVVRIAREKYFMKMEDEDIFVFSEED